MKEVIEPSSFFSPDRSLMQCVACYITDNVSDDWTKALQLHHSRLTLQKSARLLQSFVLFFYGLSVYSVISGRVFVGSSLTAAPTLSCPRLLHHSHSNTSLNLKRLSAIGQYVQSLSLLRS